MKTLTATGYVNIYWCFRRLPPCSQSSPTLVWVRSVLLLQCIPQLNTPWVSQDMQLYIDKYIPWTFPCYCFYYNPTTWAATHHLRKIYPNFWRVDAIMQGACHGWRSSTHSYTVNNNMVMLSVFLLVSMRCDVAPTNVLQVSIRYAYTLRPKALPKWGTEAVSHAAELKQ